MFLTFSSIMLKVFSLHNTVYSKLMTHFPRQTVGSMKSGNVAIKRKTRKKWDEEKTKRKKKGCGGGGPGARRNERGREAPAVLRLFLRLADPAGVRRATAVGPARHARGPKTTQVPPLVVKKISDRETRRRRREREREKKNKRKNADSN
ncbi:unnamed protein product [Nesidiocoris tenuis]|uniref:Uncharacterized protein n=1 Tax=Nesidiocoris tenuis TaxID=355587 RepID=A0A6H5G6I1_9HEMI|nr:unnamed protein product [Nesidiocoris tenuis]